MSSNQLPSAAPSLARLVQELNKLPGIGPKSAQRLAYYIIRLPDEEAYSLADAVSAVKQNIIVCQECQNLTDESPCSICAILAAIGLCCAWWRSLWTFWR